MHSPFFPLFFLQETVLQAMDISDSAFGRIQVQRPGKMRWEYEKPEKQTIVTDGQTLWMYRPADHQVMIGQAPAFLRGGQGAGFLSDMGHLQKKFLILKALEKNSDHYILKLLPEEEMADVADIRIWVAKATGLIAKIVTTNAYGDETRIELSQFEFSGRLDDDLFNFEIPAGADVVRLDDPRILTRSKPHARPDSQIVATKKRHPAGPQLSTPGDPGPGRFVRRLPGVEHPRGPYECRCDRFLRCAFHGRKPLPCYPRKKPFCCRAWTPAAPWPTWLPPRPWRPAKRSCPGCRW